MTISRPAPFAALALAFLACAASPAATATIINWSATIDPSQEVGVIIAPGAAGTATGTIDTTSGLLAWNISWSNLTGPAVAMHFHGPAGPGVNAGVLVNIGAISGLSSPSIGSTIVTSTSVDQLLAGLWYINIHTASHPGGEIRGQVTVPEPGTLALLGLGLLALLSRRRQS